MISSTTYSQNFPVISILRLRSVCKSLAWTISGSCFAWENRPAEEDWVHTAWGKTRSRLISCWKGNQAEDALSWWACITVITGWSELIPSLKSTYFFMLSVSIYGSLIDGAIHGPKFMQLAFRLPKIKSLFLFWEFRMEGVSCFAKERLDCYDNEGKDR